jgi:hypothetical protein
MLRNPKKLSALVALFCALFGVSLLGGVNYQLDVEHEDKKESVDPTKRPTSTDNVVASDLIASVLDPLNALVTPSMSGKRQSGGGSEYGFAGAIAHPADKSIDVYWVGDIEPRAQEILDSAPAGLTIVVHPASYRLVEMLDAVDKVVGVESSEGAARDYLILSAGPEEDGSGIWLEYQGEANEESIARIVSRMTNVTVTSATVGEPLQGQVGKRP